MVFLTTIDSLRSYNVTTRPALVDKFCLVNSFAMPTIFSVILSVNLLNVAGFDSSRLVASFFLLRLLTGQRPYVSRFGVFQTFKKSDYDISISTTLSKTHVADFLTFLSKGILPFMSKSDFSANFSKTCKGVVVTYTISDLSFIRVVETHSAFFKWRDKIDITLYLDASTLDEAKQLLSGLNLYFF